jgi:hypothetical protein
MEVVLLVVAVIGIALIVVPRLKRKPRARRSLPSLKARRRAAVAAAAAPVPAAVSTWSPSGSDEDGWDDDLGWEGVESPAPETREAWERWRETESPLAAAPEPVEAPPELPSVERWRAAASSSSEDAEWLDDDGLGWEGEDSRNEPRVWVAEPVTRTSTAPDVATQAETGGREWAASPVTNVSAAAAPASRKFGLHPVLMVALYAAVGIGVVVLASTMLLGGSSDPEPASNPAPKASPAPAPQVSGSLADEEFDVSVEPEDGATTAARDARRAFQRERSRALAAERKAAAAKAAQARRKAAAERRNKRQRQTSVGGGGGGTAAPPPAAPPTTNGGGTAPRPPVYNPPAPRRTCEFCIG